MNLRRLNPADLKAKILAKTIPPAQMKTAKKLLQHYESKEVKVANTKAKIEADLKKKRRLPKEKKIEKIKIRGKEILQDAYLVGKMHDKRNGNTYNRYRLLSTNQVIHKKVSGPVKEDSI